MSDKAAKKADAPAKEGKEAAPSTDTPKVKGGIKGLLTKLPVLLGGVMFIEAAVLFAGFKMLSGGPSNASAEITLPADHDSEESDEHDSADADSGGHGDGHGGGHGAPAADAHGGSGHGEAAPAVKAKPTDPKKMVEVQVVEFRTPNSLSGRTFLYDVSIYAVVRGKNVTKVETSIKDRGALIKDRIRTIIAQSEPAKLGGGSEPGLETLRRQVKYQLDEIIGDGYVEEVLVPRCIPFRTDF